MTTISPSTEVVLAAFDLSEIVAQHQAEVWRYLRYLGAEPEDADDLTQETFVSFSRAKFEQRSDRETAGYLRTVARNQLLMFRRLQGRAINTVELEAAEEVWAMSVGSTGIDSLLDTLRDCLRSLDGRARQAIDWFYGERLGRAEIGKRMELKPEGVKALLRRTRDALRKCIERKTAK